jgi:hypothetical protein
MLNMFLNNFQAFPISLLLLCYIFNLSLQTQIIFDNPTMREISDRYAQQICNNIGQRTCCVPIALQVPDRGWGWWHAERISFYNLEAEILSLVAYEWEDGRSACDGVKVDPHSKAAADTSWSSRIYHYFPQLSGGFYTRVPQGSSIQAVDNVYPDVVRYMGVIYTDNKVGNRVYTSADGRVIYGRDLFSECVFYRLACWSLAESVDAPFSYRCRSEYHRARTVAEALSERLGLWGGEVCSNDRSERWARGEEPVVDC